MADLVHIEEYTKVFGMLVVSAFGVPIPEELPVIYGGVRVGLAWDNPNSALYWGIMLPVCILGIVVCDAFLYFVGWKWGDKLLKRGWIQRNVLPPPKREKIERNFHEYGISILLFARLLPGLRMPIFMMSGVMRVPFRKFLLADGIYAIPGASLLFALGYWFGQEFEAAFIKVKENPLVMVGLITLAVGGFALYVHFKQRISTGDPMDIPVIGEKIEHYIHPEHQTAPAIPDPQPPSPAEVGEAAKTEPVVPK